MNTMQKVMAAVVLLCVAVLASLAAVLGPDNRPGLVVLAVACGLTGAVLVAVFARGDVITRLQKGTIVLALAAAAFTLAVPVVPDRYVPGWQVRLAHYPELRSRTHNFEWMPDTKAMDAVDSVISEHLLEDQPETWREYGRRIVACARRNAVPVETVVAVMRRETAALREPPELPESAFAPGSVADMEAFIARWDRWDSVMAAAMRDSRAGRRGNAVYAAPSDSWAPDWPARIALAAGELLAGFAVVIVLGLFRRKHRETSETDHAA